MSSMRIREATEADLPRMLEIYNDVVLTTTAIYEIEARTFEQYLDWFRNKRPQGFQQFVAVLTDTQGAEQVIGYCGLGPFRARHCYYPTVELHLHLAKEHRGRGFGTKILAFLVAHARAGKFHVMIAGIDSTNAPSIKLHEKLGFKIAGELSQVARKFDRWLDLTLMQLVLD
jgi:L-amino acid N-acyltransferase YncA